MISTSSALRAEDVDIIKVSYAILPRVIEHFRVLTAGSALGRGNGPVVVSRRPMDPSDLVHAKIAIPGLDTTANQLLTRLFPEAIHKQVRLFSDIAPAVLSGEFDAGVLIHEGRFTYADQDLHLVADLGALWEQRTGLPIPLGAILIHRRIPIEMARDVSAAIRRSVEYGFAHPLASVDYVCQHAQELLPVVRQQHIDFFVNEHSRELNAIARQAIATLTGLDAVEYV